MYEELISLILKKVKKCCFCHSKVDTSNLGRVYLKKRKISCSECEHKIKEEGITVVD